MEGHDEQYLGDQMELFSGGFEHIHVTFDVHLRARGHGIVVGYTVRDGITDEWVGAQVPIVLADLTSVTKVCVIMASVLDSARNHLAPFP